MLKDNRPLVLMILNPLGLFWIATNLLHLSLFLRIYLISYGIGKILNATLHGALQRTKVWVLSPQSYLRLRNGLPRGPLSKKKTKKTLG